MSYLRYACLVAGAACVAGCQQPVAMERVGTGPTYICHRVTDAPTIDGRLDDRAWSRGEVAQLSLHDGSGPPKQPTTVRAVWDATHLYMAFDCPDDDIWAGLSAHDSKIYEQEVVEVFLNENADRKAYVELEVSPNNTTFDVLILNPGGGRKFKSMLDYECVGFRSAVIVEGTLGSAPAPDHRDDRRWTVEMAIPFDQLILAPHTPPRAGDRWCWNFFRIDRGGKGEFAAWSPPLRPSFHTPERFGELVFAE